MTDERFEQDLKSVLREIAGGEAPVSLRNRVANLVDQAPLSRRLWFSPPMKLSLAAVAAVAVVAIAVLVFRPPIVGPTPSQTAEPTSSASTTPTAEPSASVEPTPVPTPVTLAWTGLDWSSMSLGIFDSSSTYAKVRDIVAWGDGYVGVGSFSEQIVNPGSDGPFSMVSAAFFRSTDGMHWTLVQQGPAVADNHEGIEVEYPASVVPVGNGLLALGGNPFGGGAPKLWQTEDGSTWTVVDSPTWREALANDSLISVAAGPAGLVVVGAAGSNCPTCDPNPQGSSVIVHSSDGVTWDRLDLSSVFDKAYFQDVSAYPDGFVIVGRVGEADDWTGAGSGAGVPAAWTSPDGLTWVAAHVEGSEAAGATLTSVIVGADGLFATGLQADTSPTQWAVQGLFSGWASSDGRSWQLLGEMGKDLPLATSWFDGNGHVIQAGDGVNMVILGRESCKTSELSGWTSRDGLTWTDLPFIGADGKPVINGPICNDDGTEDWLTSLPWITFVVVQSDGALVAGEGVGLPQGFWFATATTK